MRISDWSSDVCSSDLLRWARRAGGILLDFCHAHTVVTGAFIRRATLAAPPISSNMSLMLIAITACMRKSHDTFKRKDAIRSEEHTSELQSLMRISYAVFCMKKNKKTTQNIKKQRNH